MNDDLSDIIFRRALLQCNEAVYRKKDKRFFRIYPFTTENIFGYINYFDLCGKSLLTVGSSGDQVINAAFFGCRDFTIMDICPYTKFYFDFKKAGIISLDYEEFFEFFCYKNYNGRNDNINVFNSDMLKRVLKTLEDINFDSYLFWKFLFDKNDNITIRKKMFTNDECSISELKKINIYLKNKIFYNKMKEIFKCEQIEPKFEFIDIYRDKIDGQYDNIILSNIIDYSDNREFKFCDFLCEINDHLNSEGKLLIGYFYGLNSEGAKILINNYCNRYMRYINFDTDNFVSLHFPSIFYADNYIADSAIIYENKNVKKKSIIKNN